MHIRVWRKFHFDTYDDIPSENQCLYICRTQKLGENLFKKWGLGISIFTKKLTWPSLGVKKNIHKYRIYCIQNDRLGHTVLTKQTVN